MTGNAPQSKPAARPSALLDLDTLIERPRIAIDGELYEILSPDELSVIDSHRFGRWGRRIEELAEQDGEAAEAELDEVISRAARKIMPDVPEELFGRLPGSARWAVIDLFTGLLLHKKLIVVGAMQAAMGMQPTLSPTGARRLPGFSDTTAATPRTGWWRSLLRWSGPASG